MENVKESDLSYIESSWVENMSVTNVYEKLKRQNNVTISKYHINKIFNLLNVLFTNKKGRINKKALLKIKKRKNIASYLWNNKYFYNNYVLSNRDVNEINILRANKLSRGNTSDLEDVYNLPNPEPSIIKEKEKEKENDNNKISRKLNQNKLDVIVDDVTTLSNLLKLNVDKNKVSKILDIIYQGYLNRDAPEVVHQKITKNLEDEYCVRKSVVVSLYNKLKKLNDIVNLNKSNIHDQTLQYKEFGNIIDEEIIFNGVNKRSETRLKWYSKNVLDKYKGKLLIGRYHMNMIEMYWYDNGKNKDVLRELSTKFGLIRVDVCLKLLNNEYKESSKENLISHKNNNKFGVVLLDFTLFNHYFVFDELLAHTDLVRCKESDEIIDIEHNIEVVHSHNNEGLFNVVTIMIRNGDENVLSMIEKHFFQYGSFFELLDHIKELGKKYTESQLLQIWDLLIIIFDNNGNEDQLNNNRIENYSTLRNKLKRENYNSEVYVSLLVYFELMRMKEKKRKICINVDNHNFQNIFSDNYQRKYFEKCWQYKYTANKSKNRFYENWSHKNVVEIAEIENFFRYINITCNVNDGTKKPLVTSDNPALCNMNDDHKTIISGYVSFDDHIFQMSDELISSDFLNQQLKNILELQLMLSKF